MARAMRLARGVSRGAWFLMVILLTQSGWPGLRFTARVENDQRQHPPTDNLARVNFGSADQVIRLDTATAVSVMAGLALWPAARAAL
ncbi:MAG: hypothetical protein ABIP93_15900 [Gemmatimonadaceae bacterium]